MSRSLLFLAAFVCVLVSAYANHNAGGPHPVTVREFKSGGRIIRETRAGDSIVGVLFDPPVPTPVVLPNMVDPTDAYADPIIIEGVGYSMVEFVDTIIDPDFVTDNLGFTISFSVSMGHRTIGSGWATWSHGYTGDVYFSNSASTVTATLPPNVKAFGLYVESNVFDTFSITATANDGASVTEDVNGSGGAALFMFYGEGSARIESVEVEVPSAADGFAWGEFKYLLQPVVDGDPHFTGFHGGQYDVMGEPGKVFSILSDSNVAVNARFIQYPEDEATYMGEIGVVVGTSHLHVDTSGVMTLHPLRSEDSHTYLLDNDGTATYEGQEIVIRASGWVIRISRKLEMRDTKLLHLDVAFDTITGAAPSGSCPHGLWGQTVCRAGRSVGQGTQGEGVIEGTWRDYVIESDDLFDPVFAYNRFTMQREGEGEGTLITEFM
eukprot:TRINITY_DN66_c0_g1_i2.p1 TRINITY_DN66_c0_g1~~TRINITY_DN66_c0_g1_i2.p1  ORF type:complete len:436 (+),score=92.62 TRINITY_DN66_c0_g1_i2:57-1364(+)